MILFKTFVFEMVDLNVCHLILHRNFELLLYAEEVILCSRYIRKEAQF